jgi:hypothetical protein
MAQLVPDDLTQLALAGAHAPGLETLAQLGHDLPDSYTVFHGVHWTRQYKGHTLYGEVDFVVMNAAGALLCIEQENGPLCMPTSMRNGAPIPGSRTGCARCWPIWK